MCLPVDHLVIRYGSLGQAKLNALGFRAGPGQVSVLSRGPSYHIPSAHPPHLQNRFTMSSRASGSSTALRRLMTEYKQLTSGGMSCAALLALAHLIKPYYARMALALAQARRMACSQPVSTALLTNFPTPSNTSLVTSCANWMHHVCVQVRSPNLTSSPGKPSSADQRTHRS